MACISVFGLLLFLGMIHYRDKRNKLAAIIWDLQTTTVSDYTLEM